MKRNAIVLLTAIAAIGCDKEKETVYPVINDYPLAIGNEWTYDRQVIVIKYESSTSDNIVEKDTVDFLVNVKIERDTVMNDTMHLFVFKTEETGNSWIGREYKYKDDEGLKIYAFSTGSLYGNCFHKFGYTLPHGRKYKKKDGILVIEDKPNLEYQLPLTLNSKWTFSNLGELIANQINKKVIGAERINAMSRDFECYKVQWEYLPDSLFRGLKVSEWIAGEGLIKRMIISDRVEFFDSEGYPLEGSYQITETLLIKGFSL